MDVLFWTFRALGTPLMPSRLLERPVSWKYGLSEASGYTSRR
jgi:hypothetical protein